MGGVGGWEGDGGGGEGGAMEGFGGGTYKPRESGLGRDWEGSTKHESMAVTWCFEVCLKLSMFFKAFWSVLKFLSVFWSCEYSTNDLGLFFLKEEPLPGSRQHTNGFVRCPEIRKSYKWRFSDFRKVKALVYYPLRMLIFLRRFGPVPLF